MHSEILGSLKNRHLVATKILMRVHDMSPSQSKLGFRSGSAFGGSSYSGFKGSNPNEEEYEYIPIKKVYIFHFVEKITKEDINFISYSPSSL